MKILPGLITLSSDPEGSVRCSSVTGLFVVTATRTCCNETREKACFQILNGLTDNEVKREVVNALGRFIPAIKPDDPFGVKLRDEQFLPKLAQINFTYNANLSEER